MTDATEVQRSICDFNDLVGCIRDARKGFTIDFNEAVLASLLRIETALAEITKHRGRDDRR